MIILIACIILNALIGVIFKLFNKYKVDNLQAIIVNYFVCVLTASVVNGGNPIPDNLTSLPWFWYALGLGSVFVVVFNMMALTVQNFGVVIATIFQKMSLLAPTLIAILVYGETSNVIKWAGIASSVVAIFLLSYKKGDKNGEESHHSQLIWVLPIATFLGSCIIDSALFLVEKENLAQNGDIGFVASLFLSAGMNGLVILTIQVIRKKEVLKLKNLIAGISLGVPNFFSIYLLLLALQQGWGGSVVFPVNNVGVLVMAAIFGIVLFKERLIPIRIWGFALAVLAIVLITIA